jgi:pimeloyl-ACP methyl ester carboxylesterase
MTRFLRLMVILSGLCALHLVALDRVSAQDQSFDSNGVRIRYVDQGSGPPVVLLHGFSGSLDTGWVETGVLPNLATDYRVIALDFRGHGQSDKPHDPKSYGLQMGEDVVRLLDHLNIPRAHIVGHSMGAGITAKLLTTHPERFLTATLSGAAGRQRWTPEDAAAAEVEAVEFEQGMPFRSVILRTAPTDRPKPTDEQIHAQSQQRLARNDRLAMAAVVRSRGEQTVSVAEMATVQVPTLGLIGSADANLDAMHRLAAVLPTLNVVVIEGATHGGALGVTRRPEFVDHFRAFTAAHQEASSSSGHQMSQ